MPGAHGSAPIMCFSIHWDVMEISCVVVVGDGYIRVLMRDITNRMNTYVSKMGLTYIMWAG